MMQNGFEKQFSEPHAQGKLNSWYDGFTTLQAYFGFAEDAHTCRLQASLTRLRGVCEADS